MRMLAAAILVIALVPTRSNAQKAAPGDQEAAKAHFMAGSAYYEQANYADAVKEFNEAYRLSNRPDLLYNIALCYERLDQVDQAVATLKKYLNDRPEAPDRTIIQERMQNLERRKEQQNRPPPATPAATVAPAPPSPARPSFGRRHLASLVVGSTGAALLVAALGTGLGADQIHRDLDAQCPGMICTDETLRSKQERGVALGIASDVLLGVGAAALAVGVVLFIVEHKRPAAPRAVGIAPAGGGVMVRW